jgi:hypothetical protein
MGPVNRSIHIGLMYMDYPRPEHKAMGKNFLLLAQI